MFNNLSKLTLSIVLATLFIACTGNIRTGEVKILGDTLTLDMPAIPGSGSHAIVIFSEMHYQPSFKSQEIPRIMPNPEAVPMNGKEINRTPEEYKSLNVLSALPKLNVAVLTGIKSASTLSGFRPPPPILPI